MSHHYFLLSIKFVKKFKINIINYFAKKCSDIYPLIISIKRITRTSYLLVFNLAFIIEK